MSATSFRMYYINNFLHGCNIDKCEKIQEKRRYRVKVEYKEVCKFKCQKYMIKYMI